MSSYNEIINNIYLGSIESSQDREFIFGNNISVIVNCSKDIVDTFSLNLLKPIEEAPQYIQDWLYQNSYYIKYYRIPINDSGREKDIDDFYHLTLKILPNIKKEYDNNKKILVHCLAGAQRSASFVVAILMYIHGLSLNESINYVLLKKPNVFFFGTRNNFYEALVKLENDIKKL